MIKLKSLFRRGQGGPSGSSKHNAASRSKSQSTTSISSALENEQQQQQQHQQQQQQQQLKNTTNYYPNSSERAVDVGDDYMLLTGGVDQKTNTLSKQKGVASGKKGHKQPKQIPNSNNANLHDIMSTADALGQTNQYSTLGASATTSTSLGYVGASTHQQQQQQPQQHSKFVHNEQFHEINIKMQELQNQLEYIGKEKLLLESRVAELMPYQSEVNNLRSEIVKMQSMQEKNQLEIANLKYENESLRSHLHDVVNSPLSDAEKHQIIQDSQRLHSSAPASIALPSLTDSGDIASTGGGGVNNNNNNNSTTTPCHTPDWDKHSSSSEVSVACLQDKIIQMEETHYSTNEELQATLQELADLQSQLSDAHSENERLAEEKDVLFQSLCRQTEKLNEARQQITTLQELLLRDTKQAEISTSEREQKLLDLIKTTQQDREAILVKQEELNNELHELRQCTEITKQENTRFSERIAVLESTLDASNAERKQMELQLQQAKEEISQRSIEAARLTTLLENARSKVDELEQELARGEKSDVSDLLDAARKEKDTLEEQAAELQDQCSRSQAELRRLKEQLSALTEECKVIKNNAKCAVSNLEYRLDQLQQEKDKLGVDYQQLLDSIAELQMQCKCHLEDKTQLQNLLSETQNHLSDFERKLNDTKEQLNNERKLRKQEADEWQQFQSDLLMTVRVANDFKTEALSEREQLVLDNKTQKEKIRLLEQQIEKLNKQQVKNNETQQSVMSTVQQEMASRRNSKTNNVSSNFSRQDSRLSVKTLVESIESNKQQLAKSETEAENAITTTTTATTITTGGNTELSNNLSQITNSSNSNTTTRITKNNDWNENVRLSGSIMTNATPSATTLTTTSYNSKGPLREQQQQQQSQQNVTNLNINNLTTTNLSKSPLSGERKDPLNMLAKNGGSKRNALLKWCQNKTVGYRNIDITNFSSSWNDGLAFCAILHSYLPDRIPYDTLSPTNKRRNFSLAFAAAESVGIPTTLNINDMCQIERPDWTQVMTYVTSVYKHFET